MNARSLRFQLITWYAGLLIGSFALIGAATYVLLQSSLTGSLKDNQLRRARQLSHLLVTQARISTADLGARVAREIEDNYAPGQNNRFIRITGAEGAALYSSQSRPSTTFDLDSVPAPEWPKGTETVRNIASKGEGDMVMAACRVTLDNGKVYLIEAGAPLDSVHADLRKWLIYLGALLPVLVAIALGGGYLLVNRALSPVDQISATAERISSHNLGERLPVADTGDELERLSVALNRMIHRLDASFQHSRRFVADASHELRTPLTVLRGELESFVYEPSLPAEWRERLSSALEEVVRLSNIVEGLFAISRLDAGEAAAEWTTLDLAQLAASTADQMALLAEDKDIEIICEATKGVCVDGDRARLKQVVVNLLDNAIKYTLEGGKVVLTVQAHKNKAVLEVADTGIGIPAEALPRVFERFFRVDKARSRAEGGAGLGLSIVKSICAAHDGRVEVNSTPGQGSRFRVELPLSGSSPQSQNQSPTKYEHANSQLL